MEHFGDVSQIKGNEVPAVDVFIGGSPCQDLSIAGQRKGIQHSDLGSQDKTRSGLLLEEIRIIREMRKKDETLGRTGKHVRPRFCVWENVPGAFSSNGGGSDFRLVLESFCKIAREDVFVPLPDDGRWKNAGCVVGEGFSVAWRVMDARYWGVPQRRRRIALVADFGGKSAPEILFNEKGMRWDSEKSRETWERIAGRFAGCASEKDSGEKERYVACVHCTQDPICNETYSPALKSSVGGNLVPNVLCQKQSKCKNVCFVYDARGNGDGKTCGPIIGDHCNRITDYTPVFCIEGDGMKNVSIGENLSPCLKHRPNTVSHTVALCFGNGQTNQISMSEVCNTLDNMHDAKCVLTCRGKQDYIVRRVTPLECSRLQGLPDDWCNIPPIQEPGEKDLSFYRPVWDAWTRTTGKKSKTDAQILKWLKSPVSESAQYQMYGNGIALPQWVWVLGRIVEACGKTRPTMASLFDGTGSFPLIWENVAGKGTTLWTSEIVPDAIRVCKERLG